MPWEPKSMIDVRCEFVRLARSGGLAMREACRRFGISAKTGYKWLARFEASGAAGLSVVMLSSRSR